MPWAFSTGVGTDIVLLSYIDDSISKRCCQSVLKKAPGTASSGLSGGLLSSVSLDLFEIFRKQIQSFLEELGVESITNTYRMLDLKALAGCEHYALLQKKVYTEVM